jgi:hypothetical protein
MTSHIRKPTINRTSLDAETIICALLDIALPTGANPFVAIKARGVDRAKYEKLYASELMKRRAAMARKRNGALRKI